MYLPAKMVELSFQRESSMQTFPLWTHLGRIVLLLVLLFSSFFPLSAQFVTAVVDGTVNAGEYGMHIDGQNQQSSGGTVWYMAWDANNLYLATTGSNVAEGLVLYLDSAPILPVNGGTDADGSNQGFYAYDRNHMMQPFRADFVLYAKDGYHEYRNADGSGYWGTNVFNSLSIASNGGTNTLEIAIPWNVIGNGNGRPDAFNWFGCKVYDYGASTNGVYSQVPVGNPACACNTDPSRLFATRYFNALVTAAANTTLPFSTESFTYSEDNSGPGGGFYLNGGSFYDLTINNNSLDNSDNDPGNHAYNNQGPANRVLIEGNISIAHNLYVDQGSALLPADNLGPDVLATLVFTGRGGSIYNFGRIDANPEVNGWGDWDRRRIDFVFDGSTRLQPTDIFKDRYRLSNVTVNAGDSLLGPQSDSTSIELQWGTLENNGTIDLNNGGYANVGTRGDVPHLNQVNFTNPSNPGTWMLNDLLIGRNSSYLGPLDGGGVVRLELAGDFENYGSFLGYTSYAGNSGQIDVVMKGQKRQFIRGNILETALASGNVPGITFFHNLEIDNSDGLGGNNDAADVHFVSYGGGNIVYQIGGELTLRNGDLVTRDRFSNNVHQLILMDSATVNSVGGRSNSSGSFSSFVDGPLNWQIESSALVNREFPVGKSRSFSGYFWGDYRPVTLSLDHDSNLATTYTVEQFLDDRSLNYTWPSPVPEAIVWITEQRYWNVSRTAGASLDSARITLGYSVSERDDGVNAPAGLRIVKDDGAGNWVNICPAGAGGTATGNGTITSESFTSFSDFTLASVVESQPLPVSLTGFEARWSGEAVVLDWKTLREVNADRFVVERSNDRQVFLPVGEVLATGNSSSELNYRFWDRSLEFGVQAYQYRLLMLDKDGREQYSQIEEVFPGQENQDPEVWPSPASGQLFIAHGFLESAKLYNQKGQLVWSGHSSGLEIEVDLTGLAAGLYHLEIETGLGRFGKKVLLQD